MVGLNPHTHGFYLWQAGLITTLLFLQHVSQLPSRPRLQRVLGVLRRMVTSLGAAEDQAAPQFVHYSWFRDLSVHFSLVTDVQLASAEPAWTGRASEFAANLLLWLSSTSAWKANWFETNVWPWFPCLRNKYLDKMHKFFVPHSLCRKQNKTKTERTKQ